jgi:fructose-1,6-bisphosphatase
MDLRRTFEHLMCDAFNCSRAEYYFANADHFDNAEKHLEETFAFLLCALILVKRQQEDKQVFVDDLINKITDARNSGEYSFELLCEIVQRIHEHNIAW